MVLLVAGVSTTLAAGPAATDSDAVALVNPVALAVIVAVPLVVAVKFDVATPATAVTGDAGENVPVTPVAANEIALVAVLTLLPFASSTVAV